MGTMHEFGLCRNCNKKDPFNESCLSRVGSKFEWGDLRFRAETAEVQAKPVESLSPFILAKEHFEWNE